MTTFGVNAVAGAYAELVPLVHIVGTPPRMAQSQHVFLHHILGNGDYHLYSRIHKEITIAQADICDARTAASEIDRVLRDCFVESRPVYITLPTDMVTQPVDPGLLRTPINTTPNFGDPNAVSEAVNQVLAKLYIAKRPSILVDGAVGKRRIQADVDALVRKLNFPTFAAPMGKGCVNEHLPNFVGLYTGAISYAFVMDKFEQSDLVVTIGHIPADLNTGGFTFRLPDVCIALHYTHCTIGDYNLDKATFRSVIPKLTSEFDPAKAIVEASWLLRDERSRLVQSPTDSASDEISHSWFWPRLTPWFREGDIIVTDTGTSYVGYWASGLPVGVQIVNQILWSSIGYGIGAAQGAGLAAQEIDKGQRTICFEGDGKAALEMHDAGNTR